MTRWRAQCWCTTWPWPGSSRGTCCKHLSWLVVFCPPSSLSPAFARKILFLHCELSLALHQPEQALAHAAKLEEMLGELQGDQADGLSLEQGRVLVLKARCSVMARLTKTLKKVKS